MILNLGGIDWKKVNDSYRARLPEVKTKAEFSALVNKMLDELHASHAGYSTDEDVSSICFLQCSEVICRAIR